MSLRVLFMGSPDFAVPALEALVSRHEVIAVTTQPDRAAGRGRRQVAPPVKERALAHGIPVLQPRRIKTPELHAELAALRPDVTVVVAFGRILPQPILDVPHLGSYNVHASLLPAWRGAAPIQWAVISGDTRSGVTIMKMDAGLDTGPIALQREIPIDPEDTAGTLSERLAALGADALLDALDRLTEGRLELTEQDDHQATMARLLTKADGHLDFSLPATLLHCQARGVDPWPGAVAQAGERRVKLFRPRVGRVRGAPGEILGLDEHGLAVACGKGSVSFGELQLPGKKRLPARAAMAGRALRVGDRLT